MPGGAGFLPSTVFLNLFESVLSGGRDLSITLSCIYIYPLEVQPPFFIGCRYRTTIILVGVYHLPKGTTIFEMVVDFQGIYSSC